MSVEAHARLNDLRFILSSTYAGEEKIQLDQALLARRELRSDGLASFSIANANPGPSLLARAVDVDAAAGADEMLRTTKLRSAKRDIKGMIGEELAERIREVIFASGYTFHWGTRGDEPMNG
jgi:hypothetical protein